MKGRTALHLNEAAPASLYIYIYKEVRWRTDVRPSREKKRGNFASFRARTKRREKRGVRAYLLVLQEENCDLQRSNGRIFNPSSET
jgi:hypothetical protein